MQLNCENTDLNNELSRFGLSREIYLIDNCGKTTREAVCLEGCEESKGLTYAVRCNMYRLCPVCSDVYRAKLRANLLSSLMKAPLARAYNHRGLRHIVLGFKVYSTLREALEFGFDSVHVAMSKFVRLNYVKKRIFGGIYSIEFKVRADGSCYVHVHLLVDSNYLSLRDYRGKSVVDGRRLSSFSKAWFTATDGVAYVPRIVRVYSAKEALDYVLKYVTKQPLFNIYQKVLFYRVLFRRRVFGRIGSFFDDHYNPLPLVCPFCNSFMILGRILDSCVPNPRALDVRLLPIPPPLLYQRKLCNVGGHLCI